MKKIALVAVLALVLAVVAGPAMANDMAKKNTHDMTAWFVSGDAKAKTITIKDENGEQKTVPAMGNAIKEMSTLKSGQKVMLTCLDNEKGEHQGVTAIKPEMAKK